MLTEKFAIKAGVFTSFASLASTAEITEHLPLFDRGEELTVAIWVVGILLSIISALLALCCKFIWDMRKSTKENDILLFNKIDAPEVGLEPRLARLEGQHQAAFDLRGCAFEPTRLQRIVDMSIKKAFEERSHLQRANDCPNCQYKNNAHSS